MLRALQSAVTGMTVQQMTVDNIANNLANANTTAFKKNRVEFQDLLYLSLGNSGGKGDAEQVLPELQVGSGAKAVANVKTFTQGTLEETNRELDVAIEGEGFFQVDVGDGEIRYTRDGSLKVDALGNLVTSAGHPLFPRITVPQDIDKILIGNDGAVSVSVIGQEDLQNVGEISLAKFPNESGLAGIGGNLLQQTPASGVPQVNKPGEEGSGILRQNFLERSNVETVQEMVQLIVAQRAYEINSRVIRASDDMLSMTNNLVQ